MEGHDLLNKLCKWRNVFASWQLGSRLDNDGECKAVKDHRELTILLRAEMSALTDVLIRKGVITAEEFSAAMEREAKALDRDYEKKFPGFSTSLAGVLMDMPKAAMTMKRMGFPP